MFSRIISAMRIFQAEGSDHSVRATTLASLVRLIYLRLMDNKLSIGNYSIPEGWKCIEEPSEALQAMQEKADECGAASKGILR